jgi:hypothetical protein
LIGQAYTGESMKSARDPAALKLRLGNIASERDPRRAPWGYYCSDDHVFGAGLFLWFKSREGLLQFMAEHEGADIDRHDHAALRQAMRKVANQILDRHLSLGKGRERFNALLKGHLNIEWIGHIDDLVSGDDPFGWKLRAEFLSREEATQAIAIQDIPDFIDLLRNYGH